MTSTIERVSKLTSLGGNIATTVAKYGLAILDNTGEMPDMFASGANLKIGEKLAKDSLSFTQKAMNYLLGNTK